MDLLSARDVGGHNRASVLRALVDHGPLSRSDLARVAGVTRATIGTIVQGLLDDGLLEELDPIEAGLVGKPARPLWFAAGAGTVTALEFGHHAVRAALVDARGHVDRLIEIPIGDATSATDVLAAARGAIDELATERDTIGIGISVPGTCDPATGEVIGSSQVPGIVGTAFVDALSLRYHQPVLVENDSRAQALAEHWFGLARGRSTFSSLQTGDGLGVGMVLDGALYRGPHGQAGELGHTAVVLDGERCVCGKRGCWETIATLAWVRRQARSRRMKGARTLDVSTLTTRAGDGDDAARDLLTTYADHLAIGLANLAHLLATDLFIVHGDAVAGGEPFRVLLEAATAERSLWPVQVLFSELSDATLLGAAGVVLAEQLHLAG